MINNRINMWRITKRREGLDINNKCQWYSDQRPHKVKYYSLVYGYDVTLIYHEITKKRECFSFFVEILTKKTSRVTRYKLKVKASIKGRTYMKWSYHGSHILMVPWTIYCFCPSTATCVNPNMLSDHFYALDKWFHINTNLLHYISLFFT